MSIHLSEAGKQRFRDYLELLKKIQAKADAERDYEAMPRSEKEARLGELTTVKRQLRSAISVIERVLGHWDSLFLIGIVKNHSSYLEDFNHLFLGNGSWAIGIANAYGREHAVALLALVKDFKEHLYEYVTDITNETQVISILGFTLAYKDPSAILDSAIKQIDTSIVIYDEICLSTKYLTQRQTLCDRTDEIDFAQLEIFPAELLKEVLDTPYCCLDFANRDLNTQIIGIQPHAQVKSIGPAVLSRFRVAFVHSCSLAAEMHVLENTEKQIAMRISAEKPQTLHALLTSFCGNIEIFLMSIKNETALKTLIECVGEIRMQLNSIASKENLDKYINSAFLDCFQLACILESTKEPTIRKKLGLELSEKLQKYLSDNPTLFFKLQGILAELKQYQHIPSDMKSKLGDIYELQDFESKFAEIGNYDPKQLANFVFKLSKLIRQLFLQPAPLVAHAVLKVIASENLNFISSTSVHIEKIPAMGELINNFYCDLLQLFSSFRTADCASELVDFRLKAAEYRGKRIAAESFKEYEEQQKRDRVSAEVLAANGSSVAVQKTDDNALSTVLSLSLNI